MTDAGPRPAVLVLGAEGLLGWHVAAALTEHARVAVPSPRRPLAPPYAVPGLAVAGGPLDAAADAAAVRRTLDALFAAVRPVAVVNVIAVTPAAPGADDAARMRRVNGEFPHVLADACGAAGCRVLHVSTDGVFRGDRETYDEDAAPDPGDVYGESKLRGELTAAHCLTVRTSLFGASPNGRGLWAWLAGRQPGGRVSGYEDYVFTPVSAAFLARRLAALALAPPRLSGVVHLGGEPVSKRALLAAGAAWAGLDVRVEAVPGPAVRRVLVGRRLAAAHGWHPPTLAESLDAQAQPPFAPAYARALGGGA